MNATDPSFAAVPRADDGGPLPEHLWTPRLGASICVYWARRPDGGFDVAVLLDDRARPHDGYYGLVVCDAVGPARPTLAFCIEDPGDRRRVLCGRFEWRGAADAPQLWLIDADYPGGRTAAAMIAPRSRA